MITESNVYQLWFKPYGALEQSIETFSRIECLYQFKPVDSFVEKRSVSEACACTLCTRYNPVAVGGMIDKCYRVFYRNWPDSLKCRLSGASGLIRFSHVDPPVGWSIQQLTPVRYEITRHGLRLTEEDYAWGEWVWHGCVPHETMVKYDNPFL